ncbi:MAG: TPM domain-containing protein [Ruminococcus sp.]|nr:TPM domain-containing protein [Ruminococcus sp.]
MMKTKLLAFCTALLLIIALIASSAMCAGAAEESEDGVMYTNPETGYRVVIIDELGLLSGSEADMLADDMKPITDYGNAAFWTTQEYTSNEIDQARVKRYDLFGYDSAVIFSVNMNVRKLTVQAYGDILKSVTPSVARSVTNNVKDYATRKEYYNCAKQAFEQMHQVIRGESIAEPMKYTSYAVIALMTGVIIALCVAFSKRCNPLRREYSHASVTGSGTVITGDLHMSLVRNETIHVSSGGGGGGFGGGGGGGGGCGGGGSSSF